MRSKFVFAIFLNNSGFNMSIKVFSVMPSYNWLYFLFYSVDRQTLANIRNDEGKIVNTCSGKKWDIDFFFGVLYYILGIIVYS